jgi:hypothetical protein
MLRYARQWPERVWAIEGCAGIGKHIANRLLADGEQVVDVPPKLSARAATTLPTRSCPAPPTRVRATSWSDTDMIVSGLTVSASPTDSARRTLGPDSASALALVRFHTVTSAPEAASPSTSALPLAPVPITDTSLI